MNREAWHAAVHGVAKSQTRLSNGTELKACPLSVSESHIVFPYILELLFYYSLFILYIKLSLCKPLVYCLLIGLRMAQSQSIFFVV